MGITFQMLCESCDKAYIVELGDGFFRSIEEDNFFRTEDGKLVYLLELFDEVFTGKAKTLHEPKTHIVLTIGTKIIPLEPIAYHVPALDSKYLQDIDMDSLKLIEYKGDVSKLEKWDYKKCPECRKDMQEGETLSEWI